MKDEMTAFERETLRLQREQVEATKANTEALSKLAPTVHDAGALQTSIMANLRGKNRPAPPVHLTTYQGTIVDPVTNAAVVRIHGECELQQKTTVEGTGPTVWIVFALLTDNLADESGDLFKLVRGEFDEKFSDDLQRALDSREMQEDLRHRWEKTWRQAVWNRGRKILLNSMIAKQPSELHTFTLGEQPPPIAAQSEAAE